MPSATPSTVNAVTGSNFPFSSNARSALHANRSTTTCCVACPTSTEPGWACDCRRAATFTASPSAANSTRSPAPIAPVMTGPVLMPIRTLRASTPHPSATSRPNVAMSSTMRRPARTARSASSSCAVGAPKSARTPSPARSFTVPPNASTAMTMRATASPTTSLSSSGSSRSPRAVEPTRSANRAVTSRRSSRMSTHASCDTEARPTIGEVSRSGAVRRERTGAPHARGGATTPGPYRTRPRRSARSPR